MLVWIIRLYSLYCLPPCSAGQGLREVPLVRPSGLPPDHALPSLIIPATGLVPVLGTVPDPGPRTPIPRVGLSERGTTEERRISRDRLERRREREIHEGEKRTSSTTNARGNETKALLEQETEKVNGRAETAADLLGNLRDHVERASLWIACQM